MNFKYYFRKSSFKKDVDELKNRVSEIKELNKRLVRIIF